ALVAVTSQPFHVAVTLTDTGLDVAVGGSGKLVDTTRRAAVAFVIEQGFARLSVDGEIVVEPRKPTVSFDSVAIVPPPGAFLQATKDAELAMAGLVAEHLGRARQVADLFAGCGTLALRFAAKARVHAVEGDAPSLAALDRAARTASGLKPV